MDKRYQVFVSSTYEDLQQERQEVMHALLELDCIPAGMELFPATNEEQWALIRQVIDDCDYYILISGGRYGSISPSGVSYTEMEYRYALEIGKPIISFLHKEPLNIPVKKTEQSTEGKQKLDEFRELVQKKLCKYWSSPAELGSVVSRSLVKLIKSNPAIGWIKADQINTGVAAAEILRLKKTIEDLEARLEQARISAPAGSDSLAHGEDKFEIDLRLITVDQEGKSWTWDYPINTTWNEIFYHIGPPMIDEASEVRLRNTINSFVAWVGNPIIEKDSELTGHRVRELKISDEDYQTIKIQLKALGLISKSQKQRSVKDAGTYWSLTPYGDQLLTTLRAIKRETFPVAHD